MTNKTPQQLHKKSTPCLDNHQCKEEELEFVGDVVKSNAFQIVIKCLYLTRPDIPWTVNKIIRAITKWIRAWDKRLERLISWIHFFSEYNQYCHVRNTVQKFRLWLFQDFDTAGNLEDSKSTSDGTLSVFGSHTFIPISWMCKKQMCVCPSASESDIFLWIQVYAWTKFPVPRSSVFGYYFDTLKFQSGAERQVSMKKFVTRKSIREVSNSTSHQTRTTRTFFSWALRMTQVISLVHKTVIFRPLCHVTPGIDERAFSSFCFISPCSLFSFLFVLVSSRIPTVARFRGESVWSTADHQFNIGLNHEIFHDDLRADGQLSGKSISE